MAHGQCRVGVAPPGIAQGIPYIGAVEFTDAVVGEPGPDSYGSSACLEADEVQRHLEASALAAVAIIMDAHGSFRDSRLPERY